MALSASEIENIEQQEFYSPFSKSVDNNSSDYEDRHHSDIFSDHGNTHTAHNIHNAINHKGDDHEGSKLRKETETRTMRNAFNPNAMGAPEMIPTIIQVDLGDIGTIELASKSPEKAMEIAEEIQEMAQNPDQKEALGENLAVASKNQEGQIHATYQDQFEWEAKHSNQCSIDGSAEAAMEAVKDPNSYEAGNFAMLRGEAPTEQQFNSLFDNKL